MTITVTSKCGEKRVNAARGKEKSWHFKMDWHHTQNYNARNHQATNLD